jgi:hypothetical protein
MIRLKEATLKRGPWAAIAIAALILIAGGVFVFGGGAPRSERDALEPFAIGSERFSLPSAYFRPRAEDGAVELAAFFPDFAPAGRFDDIDAHTDMDERFQRLVFLELRPADKSIDPEERTARLYVRFLSQTSWSHPGGLLARQFEPGSPFEDDELYYSPPDGRDFAARCHRPDPDRKTPNTCLAAFRSGAIDAELRFSAALLSEWRTLIGNARGLIETARR